MRPRLTSPGSPHVKTAAFKRDRPATARRAGHEPGPPLARVRGAGGVVLHDRRGPRDRQCRAADDRPQAAHAGIEPAVGGDRVRPDLRRFPAARRPRRRPAGAPPHPDGGAVRVHRGVAGLRAGDHGLGADPDAVRAGAGRGGGVAGGAVDRDEHVPRRRRAEQGAGCVGGHRGQRRDGRGDRRRGAHPLRRVAVHLLPQRADRRGGAAARAAAGAGEPAGHHAAAFSTRSARSP